MLRGLEPGKRAALLISECQRGVIEPRLSPFMGLAEQVAARGIVPRIARLAEHFRSAGLPVVHLLVAHKKDYAGLPLTNPIVASTSKQGRMRIGSEDVGPVDELSPHLDDHVHTRHFSLVAFHGTELDAMLRHMHIDTLVLAGVSTNVAISGCALAGSDFGYQVIVAEDCIAGASAETHSFILRNLLPLYATISSQSEIESAIQTART